jgi:beta-galactosidase
MAGPKLALGSIPHGAVYLVRPEHSRDERRRDIANIRALGFNTVVLWPPASRWDAREPGGLAWDSIDQVMDACAEEQLKTIIELQGQDDNHGPVPEYLPFAHEWPNINHPEIRRAVCDFMREAAGHYKGHPSLLGYCTFNEVHYTESDEWSLGEFVAFLRRQYAEDIRALNAAWCTFHRDFAEIPRHGTNFRRRLWSSGLMQRDWFRFQQQNYAERLREWAAAIREVDSDVTVFADILGCDSMHNRCGYGTNDWATAGEGDVHGLSCYANMLGSDWKTSDVYSWPQFWRQQISAARGKQVIISELMTHNRTMFPAEGSSLTDQLRLWSYQAFFNGIKGLIYWKYRPFIRGLQVSGRGLTDYSAEPTDFAEQARTVAAFSSKHAELLACSEPDDAGCAILHDHNAQNIYGAVQHWDPAFYTDAQRGFFRGFWENGVSPRYVVPEDLAGGVPESVRVLAVPCNVSLSEPTAAALRAFVERGGALFSEGRFGLLTQDAYLHPRVPGCGLSEAFGVRERRFISDAKDRASIGPDSTLEIEDYCQLLDLGSHAKRVLGSEKGRPLLVTSNLGAGLYVHVPVLLGRLVHKNVPGALALFRTAFDLVRVFLRPAVPVLYKDSQVDVSVLVRAPNTPSLVGICNYRHGPATVELAWRSLPYVIEGCSRARVVQSATHLSVTLPAREAVALVL